MGIASKKFPILIVTENLNVGGAEKYTVLIANELSARGYRVIVLANKGPFTEHFSPTVRFVQAHFERGIFGLLYGAFQIIAISFQEHVELVHAQKLESAHAAWLAHHFTGVPVVKTAHGYTRKELVTLGKKINRYAHEIITVIDWLVDELIKNGVHTHKLSLVYNGMAPLALTLSPEERMQLRSSLGLSQTDRVVVSISRLEKGKNHAELIVWFSHIVKKVPNAKLVIVGNGPEWPRLKKEIADLKLHDSVKLVQGTTHMEPYLQIADIFCTASVAQGMAVLEAMAAGLPVVGSRPSSGPEVVKDGVTGYVATKHDGAGFMEKLIDLLSDPKKATRFGMAGKARQEQLYSIDKTVDAIERVYQKMV